MELESKESTRFYTIEDFDTKEALDAHITEVVLKKLFIKLTEEEAATRIKSRSARRSSFYRKKYLRDSYEVKFYIHETIVFKFLVSLNEYRLIPERYPRYADRDKDFHEQAMKELADMPLDIFLGLFGFQYCCVSYQDYKGKERTIKAETCHKVLMAWILGLPTFRLYDLNKLTFPEAYAQIELKNEHAQSIEELYNQYLPLYKLHETWKDLI